MSVVTGLFLDKYLKGCCLELIGYGQADHRTRYVNDHSSLSAYPLGHGNLHSKRFGQLNGPLYI